MRFAIRLFLLAVMVCAAPAVWAAGLSTDDPSGTWKGSFSFNGSDVPTTITLKVSGATVTGTVEGLPTSPAEIHDGKLDGSAISFWVNTDYNGETYKLVFTGKIGAGQIDFEFGTDEGGWSSELSAKRVDASVTLADVTGTWSGSFDLMGTDTPSVFNLKSAGGVVTGTVSNGKDSGQEIHDGKIVGSTVTFWINADYQGQTYTLQYTGKISAGQIDFSFGTTDGQWSSSVTAKKS